MPVSIDPATGQEIARFADASPAELDSALAAATAAQAAWRTTPIGERAKLLTRIASVLRAGKADYGRLITGEMGKPKKEAEAEIEKCAFNCDWYATHAADFLADQARDLSEKGGLKGEGRVLFDPLGVVLAIMPWNFPFWQFFRFLAPALAAGNGAILKHAANVPQCALAMGDAVARAGAPKGLVGAPLIANADVERLIADPRIAAVTLTGSSRVGAMVAAQAGKHLKKQVLELGGSDPFIVLADADIERAAKTAINARFANAGQSCISAKRFILVEDVADAFCAALLENIRALKLGDPSQDDVTIGPLARADLRDALHDQVVRSVAAGARLLAGGTLPPGPGFFYPPTVLDAVTPQMPVFIEETFGPLAAIVRVRDEDEAIRLANRTPFGLGASLWTQDRAKARALARRIEAGSVFVNALVASDPRLPFGGIKQSGYGRELSDFGIREFVNIKSLYLAP